MERLCVFSKHCRHFSGDLRSLSIRGFDLFQVEKMRDSDPPEGSPVNSVGSEPNYFVEHQTVSRLLHQTISKHRVVQNVFHNIRIAGNNNPSLAQAESYKPLGSTGLRHRSNPMVGKAGHKLHTPNHRKTSRTWYRLTHGSRRRSFPPPIMLLSS